MRETLIYGLSICASLFILAYTVHIFIGGLVSEQTEWIVTTVVVFIGIIAIAWMARDILKSRREKR